MRKLCAGADAPPSRRVREVWFELIGMRFLTILWILLVLLTPTWGPALAQSETDYATLLARAQKSDPALDFGALREAFTHTKDYHPYAGESSLDPVITALKSEELDKAQELVDAMLARNYLQLTAHLLARNVAHKRGDEARAEHHKYMLTGLIKAIQSGGDGQSIGGAWNVLWVTEEYTVARLAGLKVSGQSLISKDGHSYDMLDVQDVESGNKFKLYFNIDKPFNSLGEQLKK